MVKNHLKRLTIPKSWGIGKKKTKWIARPSPGPHSLKESMTLNLLLKEFLQYAKNKTEVKKILTDKQILIDNKVRKEQHFPVGIMDVISIPKTNEDFRILLSERGKFKLQKISKEEAKIKPVKVIGKTLLKGNKIQLNLSDGKNILISKDNFKTGDCVVLDLEKNNIKEHIAFGKGATVFITHGKYIGKTGVINSIINENNLSPTKIIFKTDDKDVETLKKYAYVIGKNKPIITLLEK